jgi:pimeloyl-ACP methyl ester carboxylesterase
VPEASHWIVHEQPDRVAALVAELAQVAQLAAGAA